MKGKIVWILGTLEVVIGFILFLSAQGEISSNPWYSWSPPSELVLKKWIGIILIISGVTWFGFKLYQKRYTNNHVQEINQLVKRGGATECSNCGLMLSADVKNCPRCDNAVDSSTSNIGVAGKDTVHFCSNCGNKANVNELFCSKCGQKISK